MTPARYEEIGRVFAEVCRLEAEERAAYLDRVCATDAELRAEVEALLAHDGKSLPIRPPVSAATALGLGEIDAGRGSSAFASLEALPEQIPERIGGFRIISKIGQGGMGVVYEAEQDNPQRTIALKVIRPTVASDQALRRFKFETHVLGRLQHPGIAQVYEAGTAEIESPSGPSDEQPYFAMEYIRGKPLSELLGREDLGMRRRLELFAKICDAVQHAHQKGVIHRDLKPGNILVDESGQPKVLDFGVARLTDADVQITTMQTDVGQLIGTIAYMSPEQAAGDSGDLDTRSDVYALGVLLYETLTGRLPYDIRGKTIPEAARAIAEEDPTPLSAINRVFRGDLDTIVGKALDKEKDRRYQSAAELAADLRCYLNDQPIAARPAGTLYQFRKFARRNRALVGGVVGVFLALLVGTVVSATQAVRATRAERLAGQRLRQTAEALTLAEQRRKEAEAEAAKTEAVSDFLIQMFESVNPEVIQGYDVALMRLLLDEAAGRIESEFAGQPGVKATVEDAIGWVYHNVGERERAESHLQAAYDVRQEMLGDDHPETLTSLSHLCDLRWSQGRFEEAGELCRTVIEARRRVLGENHRDTLASRYDLAGIYRDFDRIDEAETELRDVLKAMQTHLGEEDDLTLQALGGLAMVHRDRGRFDEAVDLLRRVVEARRERDGDRHPATLAAIMNLATALRSGTALDEAKEVQLRAVELSRDLYGEDHPRTIQVAINLSGLLVARSESAEAEAAGRDALERSREVNGPEHPDTLNAMGNLSIALRMQGKLDEAAAQLEEVIELARTVYGEHHPNRLNLMNSFAGVLYRQGKLDEAEETVWQVLEGRAAQLGETHFDTLSTMNNLGLLLIEREKLADAEELFASLIEKVDQVAPEGHWFRSVARSSYGKVLVLQERYEEAEPVLLEAYGALEAGLGDRHTHTRGAVTNLVELYDAWGKRERAAKYRALSPEPPASRPVASQPTVPQPAAP